MQGGLEIDISTDTDGFCCRPGPILQNRDTYFFQQQRNPTVDLVSNVVLTERFGEASSWKSDFSMPRPFQVTKMAVDPPTHRSFTTKVAGLHQKGFFVGPWVSPNPMLTNHRNCENRMAIMASPSNADFGYSTFLWCKGPWRSTYRLTLMASVVATPILQNRDTIFFSSEGIPRLIWLAMWCWPGGLVKHHPGRVTSACQDLSKSQKWRLIHQRIEASPATTC